MTTLKASLESVEVGRIELSEKAKVEFLETQVAILMRDYQRLLKRVQALEYINAVGEKKS